MKKLHRGFTLLEVVVGFVLLATLVASCLVALSSYQSANRLSIQKLAASIAAESLLVQWYDTAGEVPIRQEGIVTNNPINPAAGLQWRTYPIRSQTVCGLPSNVIRLEVFGKPDVETSPTVLFSIELLQRQK
jgi:type II secretory pathway pseudopilin PulG